MKQVLVTTGATVTFKGLIAGVIRTEFLDLLIELKYDNIVIQYGKSDESVVFVQNLIKKLDNAVFNFKQGIDEKNNTGYNISFRYEHDNDKKLNVKCIQFDSKLIQNYTKYSKLVISHAGTGSIIDTLRVNSGNDIQLIVMINEGLKDNHQVEIANAFESLGVVSSVRSDNKDELLNIIRRIEEIGTGGSPQLSSSSPLPEAKGKIIEKILCNELFF